MVQVAFTAPHREATQIGMDVLQAGGSAVDAMIAAAAAITVLYPHMNSIGGDSFWLIKKPGEAPVAIDACGTSASQSRVEKYTSRKLHKIPERGKDACVTLGGTVDGWRLAREMVSTPNISLKNLFEPAINLAKTGIRVSNSLSKASTKVSTDLLALNNRQEEFWAFNRIFSQSDSPLSEGDTVRNPDLASVFERIAEYGLRDFYEGDIARCIASSFEGVECGISIDDLKQYQAKFVSPLHHENCFGSLYNLPPPTQGIASLLILALYDKMFDSGWSEAQRTHYLVESCKSAFHLRDTLVCDPSTIKEDVSGYLSSNSLDSMLHSISKEAAPWPNKLQSGDTVWMGCVDAQGMSVSFIQSIYWEFGSAVVIPGTGIVWNNRGSSFSLVPNHHNVLAGNIKPLHTLNPALAQHKDGSTLVYGCMGGDGQPQTQSAIYSRYYYDGCSLEDSISMGRWLLGRTWGDSDTDLKLEHSLYHRIGRELESFGHKVQVVPEYSEIMGHAGAIVLDARGKIQAANDPRSDGVAMTGKAQ